MLRAIFLLTLAVGCANSIMCYKCEDCKEGFGFNVRSCPDEQPFCIIANVGDWEYRDCASKGVCNGMTALGDTVSSITGLFSGDQNQQKETGVDCCSSSLCNGASTFTRTGASSAPALALLLALLLINRASNIFL